MDEERTNLPSRSASSVPMEGSSHQHHERMSRKISRRSKGKERAEEKDVHIKEEPISLQLSDLPVAQVSEQITLLSP